MITLVFCLFLVIIGGGTVGTIIARKARKAKAQDAQAILELGLYEPQEGPSLTETVWGCSPSALTLAMDARRAARPDEATTILDARAPSARPRVNRI